MKREDMQKLHFSKQCTAKNLILFIQRLLMKGKHSYEIRCVNLFNLRIIALYIHHSGEQRC